MKKCKKGKFSTLREAGENQNNLPFQIRDEDITVKKSVLEEVVCLVHVTKATSCLVIFVDSTNLNDYVTVILTGDEEYFENKINMQLALFEKHLLKEVLRKNLTVRS